MERSVEYITTRKAELAIILRTELMAEFQLNLLHISHGIIRNENKQLDFLFIINDLTDPRRAPAEAIAEAARKKLAVLEPDSRPVVRCQSVALAL